MVKKHIICLLLISECFICSLYSQDDNRIDSLTRTNDLLIKENMIHTDTTASSFLKNKRENAIMILPQDSLISKDLDKEKKITLVDSAFFNKTEFKPNPNKAILYSAIFPGLGQLYNRKYWKLPIVYGGYLGVAYAITWNGGMYGDYMQAYKDLSTGKGDSWKNFDPNNRLSKQELLNRLKRGKDTFKRNRDLAIIVAVGLYGLCMLDAYVDAQLYDFDISPDISFRVQPILFEPTSYSKRSVGVQCNFYF